MLEVGNTAIFKSHSHPVLFCQRVRQPNIVQLKENYGYKAICHSYLLAPRAASWRLQTCQPTCNSSPRRELRKLQLFWRPSSLSQNTCRSPRIRSKWGSFPVCHFSDDMTCFRQKAFNWGSPMAMIKRERTPIIISKKTWSARVFQKRPGCNQDEGKDGTGCRSKCSPAASN